MRSSHNSHRAIVVSVIVVLLVHYGAAVPVAVPVAVAPPAATVVDRGAHRDGKSESNSPVAHHGCGSISWRDIGSAIDNRRVVLRDEDHLWIVG